MDNNTHGTHREPRSYRPEHSRIIPVSPVPATNRGGVRLRQSGRSLRAVLQLTRLKTRTYNDIVDFRTLCIPSVRSLT